MVRPQQQIRLFLGLVSFNNFIFENLTTAPSIFVIKSIIIIFSDLLTNTMNYSKTSNTYKAYPTRSLREYLAHQSVSFHPSEQSQMIPPSVEIEVDVGDGRKEIIEVIASTDIQAKAEEFCKRYHLEPYVKQLLADSLKAQFERQIEQLKNKNEEVICEQLRDIYANRTARQVLIGADSLFKHDETIQKQTKTYESRQTSSFMQRRESTGQINKENKPNINEVSQTICNKLGKENIINLKKQKSTERLKAIKKQIEEKEAKDLEECHFHPKINLISERVDRQMAQNESRHEKKVERYELLYQNFKQLQTKRNKLRDQAQAQIPFQPCINLISKKIVENRKNMQNSALSKQTAKHSIHSDCVKQKMKSQPKTGRNPYSRNKEGLPIGQYLYRQAGKRHSRPQLEIKQEIKALQHSDYLVSVLKQKRLKQMFIQLTSSPHELLTPQDVAQFGMTQSKLIKPLLEQIVSIGASLNEENFIEAGLNLINSLTPQERYELVFKKKNEQNPDLSLQCTITRNQMKQSNEDLYARGRMKYKEKQERLERSREERVRQQLRSCTFRPIINK